MLASSFCEGVLIFFPCRERVADLVIQTGPPMIQVLAVRESPQVLSAESLKWTNIASTEFRDPESSEHRFLAQIFWKPLEQSRERPVPRQSSRGKPVHRFRHLSPVRSTGGATAESCRENTFHLCSLNNFTVKTGASFPATFLSPLSAFNTLFKLVR